MDNYSIKVKNISKVYRLYDKPMDRLREAMSLTRRCLHKEYHALSDVSFNVKKGETIGLIGVNGAGKSTMLKIITGILTPTSGSVEVTGKVSALLELGAGFNPDYTGMENIYLNGTMMGCSRAEIEEKVDDILAFADIGDFIDQPVKTYSSGMFVRLAFAVAINIEPEVLIVDEALSVGDIFFQQKCYKKIKELTGKSTVVIVSHDLNAMTKFCKRIIVLNRGRVAFDGEPNEAVTRYFKIKQGSADRGIALPSGTERDYAAFKVPGRDTYSGRMDVVIEKYFYSINDIPFAEVCREGDEIKVSMLARSSQAKDNVIVGYQIRDKYSNEVFGQTSLTSGVEQYTMPEGESLISFSFTWPEVREGDYFITLGIGSGYEVLDQVEECWINNIIHLTASVGGKTIFGVFNKDMESFEIVKA